MKIIEPGEFKKAFLSVLFPEEGRLSKDWDGPLGKYTSLMYELFPRIASKLGLQIYNGNYYSLDAILFETKDTEHFPKEATYAHYIAVAIEHENDVRGAHVEINKLQLFNSPLKVLITYAPSASQKVYLEMYAEIINNADVFNDISTLRKQLVIFGNAQENHIQ